MEAARILALMAGMTASFAVLLGAALYYGPSLPVLGIIPLGIFLQIAAVGLPAFFGAGLAQRWGLPQPPILALISYCLGSGIATAVLMGGGEAAGRYVTVALLHAVTLTVLGPAVGGGSITYLANLLWVVAAYLIAKEGQSAFRKSKPQPQDAPAISENGP